MDELRPRPTAEGYAIFAFVAYETTALAANYAFRRDVLPTWTRMLRPLTCHKWGRVATWLALGWVVDHFWNFSHD